MHWLHIPCKGLLCGFEAGPEQTLDGIKTDSLNPGPRTPGRLIYSKTDVVEETAASSDA